MTARVSISSTKLNYSSVDLWNTRKMKKNNIISMFASPPRLLHEVDVAANEIVESSSPKPQRKLARVVLSQPSVPCMYVEYSGTEDNMFLKVEEPEDEEDHKEVDQAQVMKEALENLMKEHDYTPIPPVMPDKEIFCPTCGRTCHSESALIRHMQFHVPSSSARGDGRRKCWKDGARECSLCGKVFASKASFYQHKRSHSGVRPHKCTFCPSAFLHKAGLTIHIRTHTGEKPYACSMCPKRFSTKVPLKCHERTHTGERPFECLLCFKAFAMKQYLEIHMRTHTGEKPYQCTECPKAFPVQAALDRHNLVHTGEKPYACPICFKAFTQSNSVKLHVRTVHEGQKAPYGRRARREKLRQAKEKPPSPPPPLDDSLLYFEDVNELE